MKRFSKPLGKLLVHKQEFFLSNDSILEEYKKIASIYRDQPQRLTCKNCDYRLVFLPTTSFSKLGVDYAFCQRCGHCNGAYEDTKVFCDALYTNDRGQNYARNYTVADIEQYNNRVAEIYFPKAEFLKNALLETSRFPVQLTDFGAGAGYFVAAARKCGFSDVIGYEPSETLVDLGNAMIGCDVLKNRGLDDIIQLINNTESTVASFIGVLEHLQSPRKAMRALKLNKRIQFLFCSFPLFSPTVIFESVFPEVMPRHLVAGHTHLYTDQSIQYFCNEFGFERLSEWWFGLDMTDLYRSTFVSLQKLTSNNSPLLTYWMNHFFPLIDKLQKVLDEAQVCSEVHVLLGKKQHALP